MKKVLVSGLLGAMMIMSLAACSKNNKTNEDKTAVLTAADYREYITLGDYKNIEVEADKTSLEVTDEDIQGEIDDCLLAYAETRKVTEGVVKDGDTINLDFSGLLDGVAFSGGTATDYSYTIGGNFIEDLDRGLIGLEIGKEYDIPCTFPDSYDKEDLKGKAVIFVVTVNYVEEKILPEYNDEFVKMMTSGSDDSQVMNTTAELEASIKEYLAESKLSAYKSKVYAQMMQNIIDNAEIKGVPESELNATVDMIRENAEYEFTLYGSYYGAESFEAYITGVAGYESMEAFESDIKDYATEYVYEKMAITIIADNEGITVSEDAINEYAENLVSQSMYETVDEFKEAYGETLFEDIRYELLYTAVYDALVDMAKVK